MGLSTNQHSENIDPSMPATTAKRRSPSTLLIPLALVLAAVAIGVGPIGCSSEDTSETPAAEQTEEKTNRSVLLNLGVEDHTQERSFPDRLFIVTPEGNQWRPDPLAGGARQMRLRNTPSESRRS